MFEPSSLILHCKHISLNQRAHLSRIYIKYPLDEATVMLNDCSCHHMAPKASVETIKIVS